MKTKREIEIFLQNEPLIEAELCRAAIEGLSHTNTKDKSLFFGVGLCTAKEPAVAIPLDILSFFLVAERLRRFLNMSRVIVLIADTHAQTNSFMTPKLVNAMTLKTLQIFQGIIQNLHLDSFKLIVHSTIAKNAEFRHEFLEVPVMDNQYLRHEIADITWLTKHRSVTLKLGWSIDSSPIPGGHDERFFDTKLQKLSTIPTGFLYLKAGRTFDKHRQKVSPYISVAGEHRILIEPGEDVMGKFQRARIVWGDDHFGGTRKHLADIVRTFEKLFGQLRSMSLEQKVSHIISQITKEGDL